MTQSAVESSAACPGVVLVSGLVATGKSTLSRALAKRMGAVRLEADRVRGTLLESVESENGGSESRWRRDLTVGFEDQVYADLLRRAGEVLAAGRPVVLDACFPRRSQREAARALAARRGLPFLFVECILPEDKLHKRLAERDRAVGQPAWEEIYRQLANHFEAHDHLDEAERITVQSDGPTEPALEIIEARLRVAAPAEVHTSSPAFVPAPRVVSFDCWGTLLAEEDWGWAHRLRVMALHDAAREAGLELPLEAAELAFTTAWQRHMQLWEEGLVSGASEIATWGLEELGLRAPHPALEHLVRRYEEASHTSHVLALEGAKEFLAALEDAGIVCVLVCDTGLTPGRVVRRLLERAGLLTHLRAVAFSDEIGVPKPDPRPFLAALEPLGVAPEQVLHVGDLRRTDIAGARALGMRTVRIRVRHDDTSQLPDADRVAASYAELAELLGLQIPAASG